MGRAKTKLEYIQNDSARRVTYKKRSRGLLKKAEELSVLCDVRTCAVIYSEFSSTPLVWPSDEGARRILMDFIRTPMKEMSRRDFNHETYLKDSLGRANEKLLRLQRRNREVEMENLMIAFLNGNKPLEEVFIQDVGDLLWVIEDKLRAIQHSFGMSEGMNTSNVYPNLVPNGGVNQFVNDNPFLGNAVMNGFHNVMGQIPPREMQAGPSQYPSGSGHP